MKKKNISGFTMIEVMVASIAFFVILGATYGMLNITQTAYSTGTTAGDLQQRVRILLDKMANEIRSAGKTSITTATDGSGNGSITFKVDTGYNIGTSSVTWSTDITYSSVASNAALSSKVGLATARDVVRTQNGASLTLSNWLKAGTMSFTFTGTRVTISLTLEETDDVKRTILTASGTVAVDIRNP